MWHWHVMMVDVVMSWELSILIPEILKRVNFEYTKSWEFQIDLKVSKFRMLESSNQNNFFEDLSILYPELSGFRILKSSKITPFFKIQDSGSSILRMWKSWLYITWRPVSPSRLAWSPLALLWADSGVLCMIIEIHFVQLFLSSVCSVYT